MKWGEEPTEELVLPDPPEAQTRFRAIAKAEKAVLDAMVAVEDKTRHMNPGWKLAASWPYMRLWETDQGTWIAETVGKRWVINHQKETP